MRARMALSHANITVEFREILLSERPDQLYSASPKGTVPVLQLSEGTVIDESFDIMQWALGQVDTDWLDINLEEQLSMIKVNDEEFKPWLDKYKYHERYLEQPKEFYQIKCGEILSQYETNLIDKQFLIGEKLQMVDVAIMPFVRQFAHVNLPYFKETYPRLNGWLESWIDSDLFQSIMKKYIQWQPDSSPLIVSFKT